MNDFGKLFGHRAAPKAPADTNALAPTARPGGACDVHCGVCNSQRPAALAGSGFLENVAVLGDPQGLAYAGWCQFCRKYFCAACASWRRPEQDAADASSQPMACLATAAAMRPHCPHCDQRLTGKTRSVAARMRRELESLLKQSGDEAKKTARGLLRLCGDEPELLGRLEPEMARRLQQTLMAIANPS